MKKSLLILVSAVFNATLFGQISIGLTAGTNLCKQKQIFEYADNSAWIEPDKQEMKISYKWIIGIPIEIGISDKIAIYTEPSYHQKGTKIETEYGFFEDQIKSKANNTFNYVELPVLCKYYIAKKKLNAYVMAGPSFGYLIDIWMKGSIDTYSEEDGNEHVDMDYHYKQDELSDNGINTFEISAAIGCGFSYKIGFGDIFLNATYFHGLSNLIDADEYTEELEIDDIKQFNRGLSLTFGYLIPLTK